MAASQYYNPNAGYALQEWCSPFLQRAQTETNGRPVVDADVVPGRILWLPSQEELPERAVRRAHGKGAVEDGIYHHPVVVVSRPAEESHVVHFQLVSRILVSVESESELLTPVDNILARQEASPTLPQIE
jgi:hypothetical protein